ncbi:MAG TPA: hypothetical protein VEJ23_02285 [Solirubrobacteraceae bacterium]|nr:hypothetical protein [Solirubrobacteraceae bacterium]
MVLPGRRLVTVLTLTATAAASGTVATAAATEAVKPACSSATAHRHDAHACSRARHAKAARPHTKSHKPAGHRAKGLVRGHKKANHHKVKRTARKVKPKTTHKTTRKSARKASAPAKALCENGSAPARTGTDSYTCGDGSEPGCEDGSYPIVAPNGKTLVCNVPSNEGGSSGGGDGSRPPSGETEEALCEDGSSPFFQDGSFACDDGSEPYCEEGNLTVSSDGTTLYCTSEEDED